ncbi:cellulose biosynthesis protein BcsN [Shinella sp. CPCC 101442]|uniref:cellulose biosynthesis protein BcsN n=1 Tax=Shinella sp. CPCC 101442 TaxID=2932265 RepID=UPI0021534541|nr:cellulose biosynthesis protein BcsN [Shinella sp. CPCC 101442]MCR6500057.1 cellulose biosynthesis protein BcsN [Shinella sp. CPCC 101442]
MSSLLAALAAAVLGGCAARPGAGVATLSSTVSTANALVLPAPGTLSIVSVIQRQYTNAVEQQIALSTSATSSGQNFISIQAFGPAETVAMPGGALSFRPVRHSAIQAEIRSYFPGARLTISSNFVRNTYGPFGYAYGPGAGNDGCLYGWQQIRSDEADRNLMNSFGMLQIRLRVCQAGASEKQLVELMYGYTIVGGFSGATWNPYGTPASVDAEVGGGKPLRVAIEEPRRAVVSVETVEQAPVTRHIAETKPLNRRTEQVVAKDVVVVPSPTGGSATTTTTTPEDEAVVVPSPVCVTGASGSATCN